jgi:hypothetical protein
MTGVWSTTARAPFMSVQHAPHIEEGRRVVQVVDGQDVRSHQVLDVDVVPDAGAIRGGVLHA